MNVDSTEFMHRLAALHGEYPQQNLVFDRMDSLRSSRTGQTSPQNMLLVGESGVGKTHLVRKYALQSNVKYAGAEEGALPVLYVQLPLPFSLRAMYLSIQGSLGSVAPRAARSITDIQHRTLELLAARSVEMIIFDDAHNIGMSRNVSMVKAIESMNHLSTMGNVALVLVGPKQIRAMSKNNLRFFQRFSVTELHRFEPDSEEFIAFLSSIEAQIGPFPVNLCDTEFSTLLHKLSRGLIGILIPLIQFTLRKVTLENSFERIDTPQFVGALFEAKKLLGDDEEPLAVK